MALSFNPRTHYLGIVSMLLSSIAMMNIGDDEEDGLQVATPISCRSVWWLTTRLVSTTANRKSLKLYSFTLVQFPHCTFAIPAKGVLCTVLFNSIAITTGTTQGTEEMGARPYTVSPHNFYPRVETPAHSVICKAGCFSVH